MAKTGYMSSDIGLMVDLQGVDYFAETEAIFDFSDLKDKNFDVLIISDTVVSLNALLEYVHMENNLITKIPHVFYQVTTLMTNTEDLLTMNDIKMIPMKLTNKQVINYIIARVVGNNELNKNNIVAVAGTYSQVGSTMVAQSLAEQLAKDPNIKVLMVYLTGYYENSYLQVRELTEFGALKNKLANKLISVTEILEACTNLKDNLYVLGGIKNYLDRRYYTPEIIEYFLNIVSKEFEIVVVDVGWNIDLPSVIGALNCASTKILVTTQQQTVLDKFEVVNKPILKAKLKIEDFLLVVNKYIDNKNLKTYSKLADELGATFLTKIPPLEFALQCEVERRTLLSMEIKEYIDPIQMIVNIVCKRLRIPYLASKPKFTQRFKEAFGLKKRGK